MKGKQEFVLHEVVQVRLKEGKVTYAFFLSLILVLN